MLYDTIRRNRQCNTITRYRPGGGGQDDIPPADGSSMVSKIAADLRPSADGSEVGTFLVASGG